MVYNKNKNFNLNRKFRLLKQNCQSDCLNFPNQLKYLLKDKVINYHKLEPF